MSASFTAPPGHIAHRLVLFLSPNDANLTLLPSDAKSTSPSLSLASGVQLTATSSILKWICLTTQNPLYPPRTSPLTRSHVDQWIDVGQGLELSVAAWNGCATDGPEANLFKSQILSVLQGLELHLRQRTYAAGERFSLADVVLCASLKPVMEGILGVQDRSAYVHLLRWFCTCHSRLESVLGDLKLSANAVGWQTEDPEKKAKREAKARAKEEKKLKALQKKTAQTNNNSVPSGGQKSTKKAEAEAKKQADAAETDRILELLKKTLKGQKKDSSLPMLKGYCPAAVESVWYDWWDASGFFKPEENSTKPPFILVIPPPNVTGALHIGHALMNSVEDTIVRWKRMSGYNTLWVPGTDHAGIATQTVVEKMLFRQKGQTRHDIGREKFLEVVHEWVGKYSNKIRDQLMRIGSSVDWTRKRFTLDDVMSKAVMEAFITFHEKGLIYRENRLVNWCCALRTALSDIEVEYIDIPGKTLLSVPGISEKVEFGTLTSFAYPLESGDGEIVVATTRIETMLGDTAVAVHPDDSRYRHLHGKHVVHPVSGREIPIIADAVLVDMEFGTGAVKITPAHDPNDYATGKRHNLEFIIVIDDEGKINANGGRFAGQHRFEARVEVAKFLEEKGLLRGIEDNPMRLGLCSRSHDVIEPALKPQWWVNCSQMAADACTAARDGRLTIVPREFEATWFRWLENIRDWCISRQLWWGHRIPAYYVQLEGETDQQSGLPGRQSEKNERWIVGRHLEEAQEKAKSQFPGKSFHLRQDEDVLDTWFSSGLFPFSVMGWPDKTEDMRQYYPTSLLETGHDILFFWVARMVMMGMTLTGEVPFSHVYLHSMIRDAHGRKMSKSLGNVIDPLHVIEGISLEELHKTLETGNLDAREIAKATAGQKADFPEGIAECGADALRFALMSYTSQGGDINLDVKRVVAYRHWCNKLWNAIRFALINLPPDFLPSEKLNLTEMPAPARWILSRLSNSTKAIVEAMEAYEFGNATKILYAFWMDDVCDVYIELMKPVMSLDDAKDGEIKRFTREALWLCLDHGLRLLHPFMPFVTEELWQQLPRRSDQQQIPSIMISPYPSFTPDWVDPQLEEDVRYVNQVVSKTRQIRADYGLISHQKPHLYIVCESERLRTVLHLFEKEIGTLSYSSEVKVTDGKGEVPLGCSVLVLDADTRLHLQLTDILDPVKELEKLKAKLREAQKSEEKMSEKVSKPAYREKTPENIQSIDRENLDKKRAEIENLRSSMTSMEQLKMDH